MLKEGQTLWWVPNQRHAGPQREVIVQKVGRTWAQLSNRFRIDKNTLIADGGEYISPGRCYLSEVAYIQYVNLIAAWNALTSDLRYSRPEGVTIEDIEVARVLLGIPTSPT